MARRRINNSQSRISERRKSAEERQALRDARTNEEQIARLDQLLGVGVGAVKERARLNRH